MRKEDKSGANRRKTVWIIAGFIIMVTALVIFFLPGRFTVNTYPTVPAPTFDRVVLDGQFIKALNDVKSGDLKKARMRFEYILSQSTVYPGAGIALTNIRATLDAAAAEETSSKIISTMAPVQEIDPRSMMAVTATLVPTNTPARPQVPTPIIFTYPEVTATPLSLDMTDPNIVNKFVNQHHPGLCSSGNLITNQNPDFPPITPKVGITEITAFPETKSYFVTELADNSDGSLRAVIACLEESCVDRVYVKDQKTGKAFLVDIGTVPQRPLQWLTWLNRDVFLVFQSFSPHTGMVVAIDFTHQKFVHYGFTSEAECQPDATEES